MRCLRLIDALFLCVAVCVALAPTVGHLLLTAPVLAGVAGRAVLRRRHTGRRAAAPPLPRHTVSYATGMGI